MKELEIYVHIPFCERKCLYCDFLSGQADKSTRIAYVRRLIQEIEALAPDYEDCRVSSIYIGGGTPSLLEPLYIEQIMDSLREYFSVERDAEITMECNPGTLSVGKTRFYIRSGINRLSFGLQSVHNGELKMLGRIHTFEDFLTSFEQARMAGFSNINVDLMYALPGQTPEDWRETIKKTVQLKPEHISAYSLSIEKGTPFYDRYHEDDFIRSQGGEPKLLPTEEEERLMYEMTAEYFAEHGYYRYEISNYARKGYACRHNIGYWTGQEYLGLGLGASSMIGTVRFQNTSDFEDYMTKPFARMQEEELDQNARISEFMFLGLRMADGISRRDFSERFGVEPEAVYGDLLAQMEQEGLLAAEEGRIFLTSFGVDVSNTVFARLLL